MTSGRSAAPGEDHRSLATLLVPVEAGLLILPTATVCDVLTAEGMLPAKGAASWVVGHLSWRGVRVPAVSFDRLVGGGNARQEIRKLVVLYPLKGREPHQFVALATEAEPHTAYIDDAAKSVETGTGAPARYVTGFLELRQGIGIVPDVRALWASLYDGEAGSSPALSGGD